MTGAEQYARWVLDPANDLKTGRYIKLAAKRFLSDLERDDIYFDEDEANKIVLFAENYCCLWEDKWRGKPVEIKPWMAFVLQQIYGWIRRKDGLRRVRKVYVQVAKKNAKSTIGGGVVGNYHLLADDRIKTPNIFIGANNEEQAKICLQITGKVIEQSPRLYEWIADQDVQLLYYSGVVRKIVLHPNPGRDDREGMITALSKEGSDKNSKTSGGKHGINPSLGIIDEYAMSPDDNLWSTIESAQAAREEPLIFCITTAGFNLSTPCYQKLRKTGVDILEGTIDDDSYLPFLFEIDKPEDGDITIDYLLKNEDVWQQANPNIDVSVNRDFLRSQLIAARNEGGSKEVSVMTLNFNRWMEAAEVFISSDVWNANSQRRNPDNLTGGFCYAGIEIGRSGEVSAVAFLFPGEVVQIRMMYFMADSTLKKNEIYLKNKELINIDHGSDVDNEIAISWILEEFGKYNIHSFCFPPSLRNDSIIQGLVKAGYEGKYLSQGNDISNATVEWEKMIRREEIEHFNDPILAWMNGNCVAVKKENGLRITKSPNVYGIYACINALALWKSNGNEPDDAVMERWY